MCTIDEMLTIVSDALVAVDKQVKNGEAPWS